MNKNAWNTFVYYLEYLSNEVCFCKHEPFKCFQKKELSTLFIKIYIYPHSMFKLLWCYFVKWKRHLHRDIFLKGHMTSRCKTCLQYLWDYAFIFVKM